MDRTVISRSVSDLPIIRWTEIHWVRMSKDLCQTYEEMNDLSADVRGEVLKRLRR